ncbi:MAG TPA: type VI secretion system tip protein TssI/VgrG [Polyangiaceae bacterium]|jgi:type VI secretion system secreted protein VgrG
MAMLPVLPIGPVTVDGPLPNMRCRSLRASEGLGRCFNYQIDVIIPQASVTAAGLLGKSVTVHWTSAATGVPRLRHFNGIISGIEYQGYDGQDRSLFRLTARPWFWFLSRRVNCRIFPNSNVVDILTLLFDGKDDYQGFAIWNRDGLKADHTRKREFIVQYRESDYNFVQRLLENEGITYFFDQDVDKHTMMLVDTFPSDTAAPKVPFRIPDEHRDTTIEYVSQWNALNEVQPGKYTHWDFDFQNPAAPITSSTTIPKKYDLDGLEVYDYPGEFPAKIPAKDGLDEGDPGPYGAQYSALRLQQVQLPFAAAHAASNASSMTVGKTFNLTEHMRDDLNQEYLVVSADYIVNAPSEASGDAAPSSEFFCNLVAVDLTTPFRPPLTVAKPVVRGPQTATVTTQGSNEITSDPYGRVYVKFHWDRDPDRIDFTSSCPVRVSQLWAGTGFGAVFTPRVGQEVIVDFLEGDPDRPIIVGRVHNKLNMPQYDPVQQPTRSGIRSRSSPGGTQVNFNEIRFEDKKGQEELYFQAERNETTLVKANQDISVGANRSLTVGGNETTLVDGTRTTTVLKAETQTFKDVRVMTVTKTEDVTVNKKHTGTYHDGRVVKVDGSDEDLTVTGVNMNTTVHGEYNIVSDTHFQVKQKGDSLLIQDKCELTSVGPITIGNGQCQVKLDSGKISITADSEISLVSGQSSITLKKDGTIQIVGNTTVSLTGGQGSMQLAAAGATVSGPKVTVSGAASTEISGAIVKIN